MPDHPVDGPDLPPEGLLGTAYNLETGDETLAHYKRWAATYDQEVGVDNGYAQPARCAAALDGVADRSGSVLDVGCGTGLSGIALRDVGFADLDGCDFSPPMLERAAETGVYRRLFEADLNAGLGIEDGTYDHAVAVGVFSFAHIRPDALRSVIRAVLPGGPWWWASTTTSGTSARSPPNWTPSKPTAWPPWCRVSTASTCRGPTSWAGWSSWSGVGVLLPSESTLDAQVSVGDRVVRR